MTREETIKSGGDLGTKDQINKIYGLGSTTPESKEKDATGEDTIEDSQTDKRIDSEATLLQRIKADVRDEVKPCLISNPQDLTMEEKLGHGKNSSSNKTYLQRTL